MDIYIKPVKKFIAENKRIIYLHDIADVYCGDIKSDAIKNAIVLKIGNDPKRVNYLVTILDMVKAIVNIEPKATVVNMGETDTVIEYSPKHIKNNKFLVSLKIMMVVVILFFGGCTAIMSFHSDGEIPKIMQDYYKMFYGVEIEVPYILEIPYSIGLAVGIMVFFNHFSVIKMTKDPTPIEVQMTTYEKEVVQNQVETLSRNKEKSQ